MAPQWRSLTPDANLDIGLAGAFTGLRLGAPWPHPPTSWAILSAQSTPAAWLVYAPDSGPGVRPPPSMPRPKSRPRPGTGGHPRRPISGLQPALDEGHRSVRTSLRALVPAAGLRPRRMACLRPCPTHTGCILAPAFPPAAIHAGSRPDGWWWGPDSNRGCLPSSRLLGVLARTRRLGLLIVGCLWPHGCGPRGLDLVSRRRGARLNPAVH